VKSLYEQRRSWSRPSRGPRVARGNAGCPPPRPAIVELMLAGCKLRVLSQELKAAAEDRESFRSTSSTRRR
jgi:hypothetical protein